MPTALTQKNFPVDRSREYWTPDRRWLGETIIVLGGGDSLRGFDCSRLQPLGRILAINSSFSIAPFCEAVFFTDYSWFTGAYQGKPRRPLLEKSNALLVTTSRQVKRLIPDRVKLVKASPGAALDKIRQGRNSGQTGISLACSMGAKRIILLGFDMRFVAGRSHHHDEYKSINIKLYARDFVPAFARWGALAIKCGVDIINATPDSALHEFPKANIEDLLRATNH